MDITQDLLHALFTYKDGVLYWRATPGNQVKVGSPAGWDDQVYVRIMVNGTAYLAHRLIYLMHHGFLPEFIDHINGNARDNRIENLRAVTKQENNRNRKINGNNQSGIKGVHWDAPRKKWKAQLSFDGRQHYLGLFLTLEDAAEAVRKARSKHHGVFARHS